MKLKFIRFLPWIFLIIAVLAVITAKSDGTDQWAQSMLLLLVFLVFIILLFAVNMKGVPKEIKEFAADLWKDYLNKNKFETYKTDWAARFPFLGPFIVRDGIVKRLSDKNAVLITILSDGYKTRLENTDYYLAVESFYSKSKKMIFVQSVHIIRPDGSLFDDITVMQNEIPARAELKNSLSPMTEEKFKDYVFSGDESLAASILQILYATPANVRSGFVVRAEKDTLLIISRNGPLDIEIQNKIAAVISR